MKYWPSHYASLYGGHNIEWPLQMFRCGSALKYVNEVEQNNSQSARLPLSQTDYDWTASCMTVCGTNDIVSHALNAPPSFTNTIHHHQSSRWILHKLLSLDVNNINFFRIVYKQLHLTFVITKLNIRIKTVCGNLSFTYPQFYATR